MLLCSKNDCRDMRTMNTFVFICSPIGMCKRALVTKNTGLNPLIIYVLCFVVFKKIDDSTFDAFAHLYCN